MKDIALDELTKNYLVRRLTEQDLDAIYNLSMGSPLYFQNCPPAVTKESIIADMYALPPGKTAKDKYYIGFYQGRNLAALMDLIIDYPKEETAFIGLFMVAQEYQHQSVGSQLITEVLAYLKEQGFGFVRLAYVKGNPQSKAFWEKNGFIATGEEFERECYTVVAMEKLLLV